MPAGVPASHGSLTNLFWHGDGGSLPAQLMANSRLGTLPRVKGGRRPVAERCERERAPLAWGGVAEDPLLLGRQNARGE